MDLSTPLVGTQWKIRAQAIADRRLRTFHGTAAHIFYGTAWPKPAGPRYEEFVRGRYHDGRLLQAASGTHLVRYRLSSTVYNLQR